jgi:hypothetical protein
MYNIYNIYIYTDYTCLIMPFSSQLFMTGTMVPNGSHACRCQMKSYRCSNDATTHNGNIALPLRDGLIYQGSILLIDLIAVSLRNHGKKWQCVKTLYPW